MSFCSGDPERENVIDVWLANGLASPGSAVWSHSVSWVECTPLRATVGKVLQEGLAWEVGWGQRLHLLYSLLSLQCLEITMFNRCLLNEQMLSCMNGSLVQDPYEAWWNSLAVPWDFESWGNLANSNSCKALTFFCGVSAINTLVSETKTFFHSCAG